MFKFVMPALVAGIIGSAGMLAMPAPASAAEAPAQSTFAGLQESGATSAYMQFRGKGLGGRGGFRRGGFAGNRGFGNRGFRGGYGRGGFAGRGYYGGRGYGYRRGGVGAGAVIGGLAAGALIGGAIAAQAQPAPVYGVRQGNSEAYCTQRFKSYDPSSGTYLGYDGQRHPCP